jgi:hypothetical protein
MFGSQRRRTGFVAALVVLAASALLLGPGSSVAQVADADAPLIYLPLVSKPHPPLFLGLEVLWEGWGYIRGSTDLDIGYHEARELDSMVDADTVHITNYAWYDPDPVGWGSDIWETHYSVTTGLLEWSEIPGDPDWKWGTPWIMPYTWQFSNGQTVLIDGQPFLVTGPHDAYTLFGEAVQYWQLVNTVKFLFWDGGDDVTQYVHAGDITLWYDAGYSRLLLHDDVLRRVYYKGKITSDTVQYVLELTMTNAYDSAVALPELVGVPQAGDMDAVEPRWLEGGEFDPLNH